MEHSRSNEYPYYVSIHGSHGIFAIYHLDFHSTYCNNLFYHSNFSPVQLQKFMGVWRKNLRLLPLISATQNDSLKGVYTILLDELTLPACDISIGNFLISFISLWSYCSQTRNTTYPTKVVEHLVGYPLSPLLYQLLYTLLALILPQFNSSTSPFLPFNYRSVLLQLSVGSK